MPLVEQDDLVVGELAPEADRLGGAPGDARDLLPRLLGRYLWLIMRTNRWTLDGAEHFAPHGAGAPAVFAFWHEHLPLMPALAMLARRSADYRPAPIHT